MIWLFLLGLVVGSFLNVVALRYKPSGWLFTKDILVGRSHCPYCEKSLRWYELIPLISFFIQLGRCRHCHKKLTWQYPIVELLSGLTFVLAYQYLSPAPIWALVILTLLLVTLIDLRLSVIPDQLNLFLVLLGAALLVGDFSSLSSRVIGGGLGLAIFGLIVLASRGRGMGVGDLKMAGALGFLFGWPKVVLVLGSAFVLGGIFSAILLALKRKSLKEAIPFGPFLALAGVIVIFFGDKIIRWYFGIM
jgi:prepilin signal peptidase PulO-like enzyme (type II secretory pathway)